MSQVFVAVLVAMAANTPTWAAALPWVGEFAIAQAEVDSTMTHDERVQRREWLARGVSTFVILSVDEDYEAWIEREGPGAESQLREAIAALTELCGTERGGPWASQDGRTHMREQLAHMAALADAGGINAEVRRIARDIVEVIFPAAEKWFRRTQNR